MKIKKIIPILLFSFALSGCGKSPLPLPSLNIGSGEEIIPTPYVDLMIPLNKPSFSGDESNLTLNIGDTHKYVFEYSPENASLNSLLWNSDNPSVADVSVDGVVTAKSKGEATITVSSSVKVDWTPIKLHVEVYVPLEDFTLSTSSLDLDYEETYQIETTFIPSNANNTKLIYSSNNEAVVTVTSGGLVRANKVSGNAKISVGSEESMTLVKEINVQVTDKTVHVSSVSLASSVNELEVGKQTTLLASVLPVDAKEYINNGVKFLTSTPELVDLDAKTGLVKAKETGEAKFSAICEGKESNEVIISIFEVKATGLNLIDKRKEEPAPSLIYLDNLGNGSFQLGYEYITDKQGYNVPSYDEISYISSDESVATVNKDGLITGINKGTTTITVFNPYYPLATASVEVIMTVRAISLKLFSVSDSVDVGLTLTISATVNPTSISDENYQFTVSDEEVVSYVIERNVITLKGLKSGKVTVGVTCDGLYDSKVITVSNVFEEGQYIVGNRDYSEKASKPSEKGSWSTADLARHMTHICPSSEVGLSVQYKETVIFSVGDEWKIRTKDNWPSLDEYVKDTEGCAISTTSGPMTISNDNILVNEAGKYDIYYKIYSAGYNMVWVCKNPGLPLSINKESLSIGINETDQVQVSNFEGTLIVSSLDLTVATVSVDNGGLATIKGVGEGNTKVEFSDDNSTVSCVVSVTKTVTKRNIYFNSNGIADKDKADIFVHAWGSEAGSEDIKLTKVSGQDIIYTASIDINQTSMMFVRQAGGDTSISWDSYWNKSKDITIDESKNMWIVDGYKSDVDDKNKNYINGHLEVFNESETYKIATRKYELFADVDWGSVDPFTLDDVVCFAWVWGGSAGNGVWKKLTSTAFKRAYFEVEVDITNFIIVRCKKGTTTPSWEETADVAGRIYNKTGEFSNNYLGSVFSFTSWPDYII